MQMHSALCLVDPPMWTIPVVLNRDGFAPTRDIWKYEDYLGITAGEVATGI